MSNSDTETNFAELLVEMQSLLNPEMDRYTTQRSVYRSAVRTRNTLETKRLTGEITVQDETDYKAASQAVEEAELRLDQLEAEFDSRAHETGWFKRYESYVSPGQAIQTCLVETCSLLID